jgi:solute carrier family 44 protein 1 (choline transporter-like protein)/choline transporter-like protein 2/4/5
MKFQCLTRLKYGKDTLNNTCGSYNPAVGSVPAFDATGMKLLHWLNPSNPNSRLCISNCPKEGEVVCKYFVEPSKDNATLVEQIINGDCFPVLFNTTNGLCFITLKIQHYLLNTSASYFVVFNRCIPKEALASLASSKVDQSKLLKVASSELNGRDIASKMSEVLIDSWRVMAGYAHPLLSKDRPCNN